MKRFILLACLALLASPAPSPGGDIKLTGPHEKAWLDVIRKDPRLLVPMVYNPDLPIRVEDWLAALQKTTGLSITLADPPKTGRIQFFFVGRNEAIPAWAYMRADANYNFVAPHWEKTDTGYRLHGKPNWFYTPEQDAKRAAEKKIIDELVEKANKPWNDFAAKYPHLAKLRKDWRLAVKLTVQEQSLKLPELVRRLEAATKLKLTFAENLKHHDPDLGTYLDTRPNFFNAENHPAWQLLEFIGHQEMDDGRWIATKEGYRLEGKSQRLNPPAAPKAPAPPDTPKEPPAPPVAAPVESSSVWLWPSVAGCALAFSAAAGAYRWRVRRRG